MTSGELAIVIAASSRRRPAVDLTSKAAERPGAGPGLFGADGGPPRDAARGRLAGTSGIQPTGVLVRAGTKDLVRCPDRSSAHNQGVRFGFAGLDSREVKGPRAAGPPLARSPAASTSRAGLALVQRQPGRGNGRPGFSLAGRGQARPFGGGGPRRRGSPPAHPATTSRPRVRGGSPSIAAASLP